MNFTDSIHDERINPFVALNRNGELSKRCEGMMARFDDTFDKAYTLFLVDYNEREKEGTCCQACKRKFACDCCARKYP